MEAAQAGVSYWGPARELEVTRQPGTPLGLTIWGGTVDLGNRWVHWVLGGLLIRSKEEVLLLQGNKYKI